MEKVTIYSETKNIIGEVPKMQVHHLGHWHEVFSCLLINSKNNKVYLQCKNASHNDLSDINKIDISVGGHLLVGETKEDGIREIYEETSIKTKYNNLVYVGERKIDVHINDDYIIREFIYLHLFDQEFDLSKLKSIDDEVLYFVEFNIDDLYNFVTTSKRTIEGKTPYGIKVFNKKEFIKGYLEEDHYYQKYLLLAKSYILNKPILWEEIKEDSILLKK